MSKLPDATLHSQEPMPALPNGSPPPEAWSPATGGSTGPRAMPARPGGGRAGRYWAVAFVLLAAGVGSAAYVLTRSNGERADVILHTVKLEQLQITVTEKGGIESSANKDLICRVRAGNKGFASTIKDVIPDGTRVKPGDVLMTLDDSSLKDLEDNQKIVVKQAKAARVKAEKDYQICKEQTEGAIETARDTVANARIDLDKYTGVVSSAALTPLAAFASAAATITESGTFRQELDDLEGQISLARANVEQSRERADWAQKMVRQSYMSVAQAQAEKSRLDSSMEDLRSKQSKRDQLIRYDRRKMITTLRGAYDDAVRKLHQAELEAEAKQATAKTEWETKEDILVQEIDKLNDILQQREECIVKAPADIKPDSMVVYFKQEGNRFGQSSQSMIEQGAQVKESQKMLRIPNLDKMQASIKVHEAMVSRIRVGQRTTVRVDAMAEKQFAGTVRWKSPVANQTDSWTSDVKLYQTIVVIDGEIGPDGKVIPLAGEILNPDMTAEVTIAVDAVKEPGPTVPRQAVLGGAEMGATREVFVKTPNGYERRAVVLGLENDKMVEVRSGLEAGDEVVVNPKVLLGDKDKTKTRDGQEKAEDKHLDPAKAPVPAAPPGAGGPGGAYPGGPKGAGGPGGDPTMKGPKGGMGGPGGDPTKGGPPGAGGKKRPEGAGGGNKGGPADVPVGGG